MGASCSSEENSNWGVGSGRQRGGGARHHIGGRGKEVSGGCPGYRMR